MPTPHFDSTLSRWRREVFRDLNLAWIRSTGPQGRNWASLETRGKILPPAAIFMAGRWGGEGLLRSYASRGRSL